MVIVLGGKGYIASAFAKRLAGAGQPFRVLSRADVDYTDRGVLRNFLASARARFLVNAAGYSGVPNVDACEEDRANCLFANAVLPGFVREVCEDAGLPWGHVSSGCIYDGERAGGGAFTEEDPPNFCFRTNHCSFYSGTKALGEEVLSGADKCYIWRVRIPFNEVAHRRNYLQKLLSYETLMDARNSLSQLDESAAAALACWERGVPFGTYHVCNPGAVTTRQIVSWMREESGRRNKEGLADPFGREFRFFESDEDFYRRAASAPRSNCVLDDSKLASQGISLAPVEEAVRLALRNWRQESAAPVASKAG